MTEILAAVVAYNSTSLIERCVDSLMRDPAVSVVVVDNSRDSATRSLCNSLAISSGGRVEYIDPGANIGYARACNLALSGCSEYSHVAVVNPDVRLDWTLSQIIRSVDFRAVSVVSGRLGDSVEGWALNARPMASLPRELLKGLIGSRAYHLSKGRRRDSLVSSRELIPVGQLDGALLVMESATWRALEGFDERFELYYEDVDLCRRAEMLNEVALLNQTVGEHVGGASFSTSGGRAFMALRVSRLRYLRKWGRPWVGACAGVLIASVEAIARTLARTPEGLATRWRAWALTVREAWSPGSVSVLR